MDRATVDGYTETLLGRRRYIPELHAANPRVRDLGRRQALNAPIQGSASDVFKVAMIHVDRALREHPELDCRMLLTVHDELVFEVAETHVEKAAALVKERMESAVELDVPLRADIGSGRQLGGGGPRGPLTTRPRVDGLCAGHLPSLSRAARLRHRQLPPAGGARPARGRGWFP